MQTVEEWHAAGLEEHTIKNDKRLRKIYTSLEEPEWAVTFEKLNPDHHVLRVMQWTPEMKKGGVLYGPPGIGKSTLGKALINRWASEKYRARFITIGDALDNIRNAIDSEDSTPEIEMDRLRRIDFLFLDDFGTEKLSEYMEEKLFGIIDYRWRHEKHTWFSSNLSTDDMKKRYAGRISDRLVAMCSWIGCEGQSYRRLGFKNEI